MPRPTNGPWDEVSQEGAARQDEPARREKKRLLLLGPVDPLSPERAPPQRAPGAWRQSVGVGLVLAFAVLWRAWPLPMVIGDAWVGAHHGQDSVLHALSLDLLATSGLDDDATPWLKPHTLVRGLTDQVPAYAPLAAILSKAAGSALGGYHLLTLLVLWLNGLSAWLLFRRLVSGGPALLGAILVVLQPWMGLHLPRVQLLSLWPLLGGLALLLSPRRSAWRLSIGLGLIGALAWGTGLILASFVVPGLLIATLIVARVRGDGWWGAAGSAGLVVGSAAMWPLLEVHARLREAYPQADHGDIRDGWAENALPLFGRSDEITLLWSSSEAPEMEQVLFPGAAILVVGALAAALRVLGRLDVLIQADSVLVRPMALLRGIVLLGALGVGLLQRDLGPFGWGLLLVTAIGPLVTAPSHRRALGADLFALLALAGLLLGVGSLVVLGEQTFRTPMFWLAKAGPLYDSLRTPHRLLVFAHLGFLGLLVLAIDVGTARLAARQRWWVLLGGLLVVDVLPTPARVSTPPSWQDAAPSLRAVLERPDDGLLIHLPYRVVLPGEHDIEAVEAERMLWQQAHGHPMLNGFAGFLLPLADRLLHDRLERVPHPERALQQLGVRYVHLEWQRMTEVERQRWGRWVVNTDGARVLAESDRDLLVALAPATSTTRGASLARASAPAPEGCWLGETPAFSAVGQAAGGGVLREAPTGEGASVELRCTRPMTWTSIVLAADGFAFLPQALSVACKTDTGWEKVRELDEVLPWADLARPGSKPILRIDVSCTTDALRVADASPTGGRWSVGALGGSARSASDGPPH